MTDELKNYVIKCSHKLINFTAVGVVSFTMSYNIMFIIL
jgi:hypothetical protein